MVTNRTRASWRTLCSGDMSNQKSGEGIEKGKGSKLVQLGHYTQKQRMYVVYNFSLKLVILFDKFKHVYLCRTFPFDPLHKDVRVKTCISLIIFNYMRNKLYFHTDFIFRETECYFVLL